MPTSTAALHTPVLLQEISEALSPCLQNENARYLDGTLGLGGHAEALLAAASPTTAMCGLDRDDEALELSKQRLAPFGERIHLFHTRYSEFATALDELAWPTVNAALIDIGVSSMQIDQPERGFSFHADGPLDMRMNRTSLTEEPVSRLVNRARVEELRDIIARYGEEPQAGRIAAAIVRARHEQPIETTARLASVVELAYPAAWRAKARNHPATRTFQALRMAVNDELGELERFMDAILARMAPGGRLAVISFHSLEDRVVKHRMKNWAQGCICPPHMPVCSCGHSPEVRILTQRPVTAKACELAVNPRSSCAKLRMVEKLDAATGISEGRTSGDRGHAAPMNQAPRGRKERLRAREEKLRRVGRFGDG